MKLNLRALFAFSLLVALLGGAFAMYRYFNRELTLKIGVETVESEEAQELYALSQWLIAEKRRFRFALVPIDKTGTAPMLTSKKIDMAIMRSDDIIPRSFSSLAVISKEAAILIVPAQSSIKTWNNLKGKKIGVVGRGDKDDVFLKSLLKIHAADNVTLIELTAPQALDQLAKRQIQAILSLQTLNEKISVMKNLKESLKIIAIEETETKAGNDKRYSELEIPAGSLKASPLLPDDDVSTLAVSRHLIASERMPNRLVSLFLRDLYDAKRALLRDNPKVKGLQSPDIETDAHVKVHAGASLYYNNEETSVTEILTDNIYLIPVILGALGSFIIWLLHFLTPEKQHANPKLMLDIIELKKLAGASKNHDELLALKERFDLIFIQLKQRIDQNHIEEDAAFTLIQSFEETENVLEKRLKKYKQKRQPEFISGSQIKRDAETSSA